MNERGAHEPRHERSVLDRIPEPPAAPAELVVGPPAAERDADSQEQPGDRGPRPHPARPQRIQFAFQHRSDCERERHRHADVAGVEHRRMDRERRILQQRIQIATVLRGRPQALERIRRRENEEREAGADQAQHAEHATRHRRRHVAAERSDRDGPDRLHEQPQQQRAFMRAPHGGESIERRQRGVRVLRDVQHGEVVQIERIRQAREREGGEHELARDGARRQRHPVRAAIRCACEPEERLRQREAERQDQREMSELGSHGRWVPSFELTSTASSPEPSVRAACAGSPPLRAACSSRRVSPALRARRTLRRHSACRAR